MPAIGARSPASGGAGPPAANNGPSIQPLGEERLVTKYDSDVSDVLEYQVSSSGQMSLPATARHRWHLDQGGPVDVIDLGFGVLTVPRGQGRRLLGDVLSRDDHAAFVASLADDPDLATT
jgi:bifunctional DNA-binding transcriptional regulator/antitoxin component of YhaV-PrlF toxin-antitoxin module